MSVVLLRHLGHSLLIGILAVGAFLNTSQAQQSNRPDGRLAPGLTEARGPRQLRVSVTDEAAFRQWVTRTYPAATVQPELHQRQLLRVRGVAAAALAACPWVSFVQAADRQARPERLVNGADFTANKVTTVHARYPQLTGQGLTVSVKEAAVDINDLDFKGRLVNPDPQAPLLNSHATTMATLIAGGGNSGPNGKGAAWQARIAQSSYDNLLPDDGPGLVTQSVSVQNHSYGVSVENFYGQEARAYDEQARQYPTLLHVFSAGNSGNQPAPAGAYAGLAGTANLTGEFKNAKNSLSVGATDALGQVSPLSSRGPAADGRVKPELVAFGEGGTSDAAALVSGVSLLTQHAHRQRTGTLPSAALVRAALLNTADDTGRPNVDFVAGYGQVDALGAVQTMLEGRFREGSVATGQEQTLTLTVPPGVHRLKVTLCWTDAAAAANAAVPLLNDLDLTLTRPADGQRWLPWTLSAYPHLDSLALPARRRPNHRDNAEQITLDFPAAGTYELRVRGYQLPQGPQVYSLAYELESGLTWVHPVASRDLRAAEAVLLRWQWAGPAAAARLEFQPAGQAAWSPMSTSVDLARQTLRWTAPAAPSLGRLRLLTGAESVESDTFFVAAPLALQVLYSCPEETRLAWNRVPGATHYQVYRLGTTHLEPYRLLTDTSLVLPSAEAAARYFAVAPRVGGRVRERSLTVDAGPSNNGCYIRSFLPLQPVSDTVQFNLLLTTTYQLRTLALERRSPDGSFVTVQKLSAGPSLAIILTDPNPVPGRGEYRARVELTNGRSYYSAVEAAFFLRTPADVLVYPVPVTAGELLTIVGPRDQALRLRVFDLTGRLRLDLTTDSAAQQSLNTSLLEPGTFLLRIGAPGGREVTRRIVVL